MNILVSIHLYPPKHNCGAEWMMHHLLKDLQSRGHSIKVLLHQANKYSIKRNYVFDGIDVFPPDAEVIDGLFAWSHCVFTHLDYTKWTIMKSALYGKPLFHFVHNSHFYQEVEDAIKDQYVVYNSAWVGEILKYNRKSCILQPPVDYRYYDTKVNSEDNKYITLINLNENKGGSILYEIAKAMPNKSFLGVKGSYDTQVTQKLPNITYIENTKEIRDIYKQTRILIMPSEYESWGRTATEAMCSGIPVICTDGQGLKENCDKAGIYIKDRHDIKSWVSEINKLDEQKAYQAASRKAKARSRELDPRKALDEFETWFRENVNRHKQ
jgi:glycosyltransferase involved in cell wall biosynthesis